MKTTKLLCSMFCMLFIYGHLPAQTGQVITKLHKVQSKQSKKAPLQQRRVNSGEDPGEGIPGGDGGTYTCAQAEPGTGATISCGGSAMLGATVNGNYSYSWYPATGLNSTLVSSPTASPLQTTTYTLTMTPQPNFLTNGGFESGNTGFSSDYTYGMTAGTYMSYTIANNASSIYSWWCNNGPIEGSNMLVVDGATAVNKKVWSQTVSITPNTKYTFSGQFLNIFSTAGYNDPNISIFINGVSMGPHTLDFNDCGWTTLSTTWLSGSSDVTATIDIYSEPSVYGNGDGNDFAIDNLVFNLGECPTVTGDVTVVVTGAPTITADLNSGYSWQTFGVISPNHIVTCDDYEAWDTKIDLITSLTSNIAWYRNNTALGASSQTYTARFTGSLTSGDVYRVTDVSTGCTSDPMTLSFRFTPHLFVYPDSSNHIFTATTYTNYGPGTTYSWTVPDPNVTFLTSSNQRDIEFSFPSTYHPPNFWIPSGSTATNTISLSVSNSIYGCVNVAASTYFRISASALTPRNSFMTRETLNETAEIFPNPAKTTCTIESTGEFRQIKIIAANGATLKTINKQGRTAAINVSNLATGTYLIQITYPKNMIVKKLIVHRE